MPTVVDRPAYRDGRRLYITWVTAPDHGLDHAVTDEDCAAVAARRGWFHAVCGAAFLPAPMEFAPSTPTTGTGTSTSRR